MSLLHDRFTNDWLIKMTGWWNDYLIEWLFCQTIDSLKWPIYELTSWLHTFFMDECLIEWLVDELTN